MIQKEKEAVNAAAFAAVHGILAANQALVRLDQAGVKSNKRWERRSAVLVRAALAWLVGSGLYVWACIERKMEFWSIAPRAGVAIVGGFVVFGGVAGVLDWRKRTGMEASSTEMMRLTRLRNGWQGALWASGWDTDEAIMAGLEAADKVAYGPAKKTN